MKTTIRIAARAVALASALPLAALAGGASRTGTDLDGFATLQGCTFCHHTSAPASNGRVPLAPSWREIAARHRGDSQAEERLTRIVMQGANPAERHWKDRIEFVNMRGNEVNLEPGDARALVRWILAHR